MQEIIEKARAMRAKFCEAYSYGNKPLAVNTLKFQKVVEKETGYTIDSNSVPNMGELRGMLIRYPDKRALILISEENNECWKRFTFMKEISHLFLETESDCFNTDAFEQAKVLVDRGFGNEDLYRAEVIGAIAALEIMLPIESKPDIAHRVRVNKDTPHTIAFLYKVPQKFVEYRLRQWSLPIN